MSQQADPKPVPKEAVDDPNDDDGSSEGPEARLLSLLNATQSTLTIEPAGRVVYINLTRAFFQKGATGSWLQYLTRQKLSVVVCSYWINTAIFLALPFCGSLDLAIVLPLIFIHIASAAPVILCSIAGLNIDIICVLLSEYEFRFVTLFNAVNWCAVAAAFGDVRAVCCWTMWTATQIAFMVDSNARSLEVALKTSFVLIPILLIVLGLSLADVLGGSNTRIAKIGTRQISINDILLTTAPTLALFLAKTVYHQRGRVNSHQRLPGTNIVYCSIYQKRLTLQKVLPSGSRRQARISPHLIANPGIPLLRSHLVMSHVNTKNTILQTPRMFAAMRLYSLRLMLLYILGIWGFLTLGYASIAAQLHQDDPATKYHHSIPCSTLAATIVFCGTFASMYQRDLVFTLAKTFDLAFSSLQFTIASLCLCDMMRWDFRCVNVLTWWLWYHWVLFLDALTPPVRALLQFKKFPASCVVLFTIYGYLTVLILLYCYDDTHLHDRAWVESPPSSSPSRLPLVRTESVLVGQLATLALWNTRLLWDLGVRTDAELVFLRDLVEYYTPSGSSAQLLGLATLSPRFMFFRSTVAPSSSSQSGSSRMGAIRMKRPLRPSTSLRGDQALTDSPTLAGSTSQLDASARIVEEVQGSEA